MTKNFAQVRQLSETGKQTLPVCAWRDHVCAAFKKHSEATAAVESKKMPEPAGTLEVISSELLFLPVGKLSLHEQKWLAQVSQVPWSLPGI